MKRKKAPKCKCGCGQRVSWCKRKNQWNKFLPGHNLKASLSLEKELQRREKIKSTMNEKVKQNPEEFKNRNPFGGKSHTIEAREKMSKKAKEREQKKREQGRNFHSQESRNKMSKSRKNKPVSEKTKRKISKANKGKRLNQKQRKQVSKTLKEYFKYNENSFKGKSHSKISIQKMSEANKGRFRGENGPNWQGGISSYPYGVEWTPWLKQEVKERDGHKCKICGENEQLLDVHHIDFDKNHNEKRNLITLCKHHHGKANRGHISQSYLKMLVRGRRVKRGDKRKRNSG